MNHIDEELFKHYNSYQLHLKYPNKSEESNWLDSCEILNRIFQGYTYLQYKCGSDIITSSFDWIQTFEIEVNKNNMIVYYEHVKDLINMPRKILAVFKLPLELPTNSLHIICKERLQEPCDNYISSSRRKEFVILCPVQVGFDKQKMKPSNSIDMCKRLKTCIKCQEESNRKNIDGTLKSKKSIYSIYDTQALHHIYSNQY